MGKRGNNSKKRRRTSAEGGKGPKRKFPVDKAEDDNAKEDGGVPAWDHLQDELILRIFFLLPLRDLVRTSVACRRWHRLAFDQSLWHSVDLHGVINTGLALEQVLKAGVRRLSLRGVINTAPEPKGTILLLHSKKMDNTQHFEIMCRLKITEMDLSMTPINTLTLERIISCCTRLECVSLSGMKLSCAIFLGLGCNRHLRQLNLSKCNSFSLYSLCRMLRSCSRIQQLNMSDCIFHDKFTKTVLNNVSSTVTHLDLSGKRGIFSVDDLNALVKRCPDIRTLHFNHKWHLTVKFLPALYKLKHLEHLSLNGCYYLHAMTDARKTFPSLKYLDMRDCKNTSGISLIEANPGVCINHYPSFVVASPTQPYESGGDLRMWDRKFRLRFP
ncbi:S-phase kinase-associated protein 2-like isoform X1 [Phyllopteryx taeniolatus]|uniref:S-phase kinase-associated protein 2-like isoform X1 n=1 Tax=Phyllopteryx taeniolatus TaxID=161469 RepID=UPI002AD285BD|nr:S-phase kinase-associated protein 2-like isoform X1 [Phyllopteryx taeniolatus]